MSFVNSVSATKTAQVMSKIDTTASGVSIEGIYSKTQVDNKFVANQAIPLINPFATPFTWNDIASQNFVNTRNFATLDDIYPVGSIYLTASAVSPSTSFGGSWVRYAEGKCLFGVDDTDTDFALETTGGVKEVVLTEAQMPSHTHTFGDKVRTTGTDGGHHSYNFIQPIIAGITSQNNTTDATGGGQAHENLPPYIAIYIWKRTA
jgi:hypothetical protein